MGGFLIWGLALLNIIKRDEKDDQGELLACFSFAD